MGKDFNGKRGYDRFFVRHDFDGEPCGYLLINSAKGMTSGLDGPFYADAVEFRVGSAASRGDSNISYPVVRDEDFSDRKHPSFYNEVAWTDFPAPAKRKYKKWESEQ